MRIPHIPTYTFSKAFPGTFLSPLSYQWARNTLVWEPHLIFNLFKLPKDGKWTSSYIAPSLMTWLTAIILLCKLDSHIHTSFLQVRLTPAYISQVWECGTEVWVVYGCSSCDLYQHCFCLWWPWIHSCMLIFPPYPTLLEEFRIFFLSLFDQKFHINTVHAVMIIICWVIDIQGLTLRCLSKQS